MCFPGFLNVIVYVYRDELELLTNCLYGEGGDWTGAVPQIPASQRIPEVILDTTTMGHEAVVVKNGLRLCGTGSARGSAPILQDKAYWEVIYNT